MNEKNIVKIFIVLFITYFNIIGKNDLDYQVQLNSKGLTIRNGFISLCISNDLQITPSLLENEKILSIVSQNKNDQPTFGLIIENEIIKNIKVNWNEFKEISIQDSLGKGKCFVFTAYSNRKLNEKNKLVKLKIELNLYLYEQFPLTFITQFKVTNKGKQTIKIDKLVSNYYQLDRSLNDPSSTPWEFASFQGVSMNWGKDYSLIYTTANTNRKNFLGITTLKNGESTGGGIPLIDLWTPQSGIAILSIEPKPQWISMPVKVNKNNLIEIAIVEDFHKHPFKGNIIKPTQTISSIRTATVLHKLDYYYPLSIMSRILRKLGVDIPKKSPEQAYIPYWKSWGLGEKFNLEQIYTSLDKLKKVGINWANVDDGWFNLYGDWEPNRAEGKFPHGDSDMIKLVDSLHAKGFKSSLWWYPQGVSPDSKLFLEHPNWVVKNRDGSLPKDSRGLYYLCPTYKPCIKYAESLVNKILNVWNFDGLYIDTDALNATPPCYNEAHKHNSPAESFQEQSVFYRAIYEKAQKLKPDLPIELCACARPHDPYKMPYYNVSTASDPTTVEQLRRRVKVEKAIHGPTYCVGDCYQIPINEWEGYSVPESFESAVGIGAQVTTFFKNLNNEQTEKWKKWIKKYNKLKLSNGEYLNLYDIAWDKPETHVIKKNGKFYYAFYSNYWSKNKPITLRGLDENCEYKVRDYANNIDIGNILGSNPIIKIAFKEYLLLEVIPIIKKSD